MPDTLPVFLNRVHKKMGYFQMLCFKSLVWSPLPYESNTTNAMNLSVYICWSTEYNWHWIEYNMLYVHIIYSHSSVVHLSSYYQAYVARSLGRPRHMREGRWSEPSQRFDTSPDFPAWGQNSRSALDRPHCSSLYTLIKSWGEIRNGFREKLK